MKIILIVEGKTEKVFLPYLRKFLESRLSGKMPKIEVNSQDGRIPKEDKLKRLVHLLLSGCDPADHVIALTDVYTGTQPPDFTDAADAKKKMRQWVGNEPRFHPHVALYDFEAWLLPYWSVIQKVAGHKQKTLAHNPETVNHNSPPAHRLKEIFEIGKHRSYVKTRDAKRILDGQDLSMTINQCAELKALVNTIFSVCGTPIIP